MILIADPTRMTADLLCRRLRADGFEATAFATAAVALSRLAQKGVEAIIVDPALPSGDEPIVAKMRAAAPDVPILAFGSSDRSDEVATVLGQGANAFLTKGRITPTQLVAGMNEMIARAKGERPAPQEPPRMHAQVQRRPADPISKTDGGYYVWVQPSRGDADRLGADVGAKAGMRCPTCNGPLALYLQRDTSRWGNWLFGTFGCLDCAHRQPDVPAHRPANEPEFDLEQVAQTLMPVAAAGGGR